MEVLVKLNPTEAKTAINSGALAALIDIVHESELKAENLINVARMDSSSSQVQQTSPQQQPGQPVYQPEQQNTQIPTQPTMQQGPGTVPMQPQQPQGIVPTQALTYTMDQLAVAATQLMDAGKRAELVNLLASFGVQALTQLNKEQYGAFATQLRAMGAKI